MEFLKFDEYLNENNISEAKNIKKSGNQYLVKAIRMMNTNPTSGKTRFGWSIYGNAGVYFYALQGGGFLYSTKGSFEVGDEIRIVNNDRENEVYVNRTTVTDIIKGEEDVFMKYLLSKGLDYRKTGAFKKSNRPSNDLTFYSVKGHIEFSLDSFEEVAKKLNDSWARKSFTGSIFIYGKWDKSRENAIQFSKDEELDKVRIKKFENFIESFASQIKSTLSSVDYDYDQLMDYFKEMGDKKFTSWVMGKAGAEIVDTLTNSWGGVSKSQAKSYAKDIMKEAKKYIKEYYEDMFDNRAQREIRKILGK